MQKYLKRKSLIREIYESPNDFLQRVKDEDSGLGESLQEFTESYVKIKYKKDWNKKEREYLIKQMRSNLNAAL